MKKVAGIISLMGCCTGVMLCFFLMVKATHLDIKEQEELIATKEYKLRERQRELRFKESELARTRDDKTSLWKEMVEVHKLMKKGYTHYNSVIDTEKLSEKDDRLSKERNRVVSKQIHLEMEISSIKAQQYEDSMGITWYTEDSIKGLQEAIKHAQAVVFDIRKSTPEVILIGLLGVSILMLGIHYVITTRFDSKIPMVLQHIEKENDIIRKQIEKRELLLKLENIENK